MTKRMPTSEPDLEREMRYADLANILDDYPSPEQRAAMRALAAWLSLTSACAWRDGDPGNYTTHLTLDTGGTFDREPNGYVIGRKSFDALMLALEKKP